MRCYDGCPDKELQAVLDAASNAHAELRTKGLRATYFPMEGKWMVFKDVQPVSEFKNTVVECAVWARSNLS